MSVVNEQKCNQRKISGKKKVKNKKSNNKKCSNIYLPDILNDKMFRFTPLATPYL